MRDRVAISNIAWNPDEEDQVLGILKDFGVQRLEIAPTKIWPRPLEVSSNEAIAYAKAMEKRGFRIVSMQSLLFGQDHVALFGTEKQREDMMTYLKGIITLASNLGAGPLVFGSPKHRRRGDLAQEDAFEIAAAFFRELGGFAAAMNTCVVFEANAPQYGCDFVTTATEAHELVKRADAPGFALHLDTGNMIMAEEPVLDRIRELGPMARHFHLSAPQLGIPAPTADLISAMSGYSGIVSIEMKRTENPLDAIRNVLDPLFSFGA